FLLLLIPYLSFLPNRLHRTLLSFPTRRSSDLIGHGDSVYDDQGRSPVYGGGSPYVEIGDASGTTVAVGDVQARTHALQSLHNIRSEEHTSELQSRENLVCRLLLEKKKKTKGYS